MISGPDSHEITCAPDDLHTVRAIVEEKLGPPEEASLVWKPNSTVEIEEEVIEKLFKLFAALDESDDVQSVSANYEADDTVAAPLMD